MARRDAGWTVNSAMKLLLMNEADWQLHADHAWQLSQNLRTSGFPSYLDGIKTREDFEQSAQKGLASRYDILLRCETGETTRGYIHAFYLPDEAYASVCLFLFEDGWQEAMLRRFVAWARERWPKAQLDMGFPPENCLSCAALAALGFEMLEQSEMYTLNLGAYTSAPRGESVRPMEGTADETSFARLHRGDDMFWTAERVLEQKEQWLVLLHRGAAGDDAALLCRRDELLSEIFGVFYKNGFDAAACHALYAACLWELKRNECKNLVVMIEGEDEAEQARSLGLERKMGYAAYTTML